MYKNLNTNLTMIVQVKFFLNLKLPNLHFCFVVNLTKIILVEKLNLHY